MVERHDHPRSEGERNIEKIQLSYLATLLSIYLLLENRKENECDNIYFISK